MLIRILVFARLQLKLVRLERNTVKNRLLEVEVQGGHSATVGIFLVVRQDQLLVLTHLAKERRWDLKLQDLVYCSRQ